MAMTSQFSDMMSSSDFFHVAVFVKLCYWFKFYVNIITVLELWQFSFIRDWPEIWKSEIIPSEFCPIPGDWGELGIPNLARMSQMKSYWMLQHARVSAFTVSELLRENQQGGLPPPRLGLRNLKLLLLSFFFFFSSSSLFNIANQIILKRNSFFFFFGAPPLSRVEITI